MIVEASEHHLARAVPAHVPPHLVHDFVFATQPGAAKDPYRAGEALWALPDIYFAPNEGCPTRSGVWVIARATLIREAYTRTDIFSNRDATGFLRLIGRDIDLLPVETDPPEHGKYRALLRPWFTPVRLKAMEGDIRARAVTLIDAMIDKRGCEFESTFGRPFPATVFIDMMGLPADQLVEFVRWENGALHGDTVDEIAGAVQQIADFLEATLDQRRSSPHEDLLSHIATSKIEGRILTNDEALGMGFLLFLGGLDTVTATINFIFKYLASDSEAQSLLRIQPEYIPNAIEEFLRAYTVTPSPRLVAQDTIFHGVRMKKGDRVMLAVPMSGRDPREYDAPERIDFGRRNIRHLGFAAGPHFCLGADLARREIRIALEEWLVRLPPFHLDPSDLPRTTARGIWSVTHLPLIW